MAAPHREPEVSPRADEFVGRRIGRFQIKRLLGAGGMGEVYLADDTVLRREVAVKRLSAKLRSDPDARSQVLKEAQRASALSSANIAGVHDVLETPDELLLVMEYVEGDSLRRRMLGAPQMPVQNFLPIAIQCADALAAAHARGIVHRDIKPENIMLNAAGVVKVLDFGLARRVTILDESSDTASLESQRSNYAGTPGYMAPEVLRDEPSDARADIFSLGVVFYEMLTGQHPFRQAKPILTQDSVLHHDPRPLCEAVPGAPKELERIVSKMLAKDPGARYATTADLAVDLRTLQRQAAPGAAPATVLSRRARFLTALLTGAAVVAIILLLPPVIPHPSKAAFEERDWVLICDFDNGGGDPIFDKTLNEALAISLQQSSYVNMLPRERVYAALQRMQRNSTAVDEATGREIALRENAQVLLAGSIQRSGEALQIRVRALEPRSGRLLFAEEQRFTRKEELFDRVDTIANGVRRDLGESLPRIQKSSQPLQKVTTRSLEALQLYSKGVDELTQGNVDPAATRLQAALAVDRQFAMAHYKLAVVYQTLGQRQREIEEVEKAYALRDRVTERERYFIEAEYFGIRGKLTQSTDALEILVNLYPDDVDAQYQLSLAHSNLRKYDKAIADLHHVLRLNPYFAEGYASLVLRLAYGNANEEALQVYSAARSRGIQSPRLEWGKAMALLNTDHLAEVRQVLGAIQNQAGYGNIARVYLERADIYEGRLNAAIRRLESDLQLDLGTGSKSAEVLRRLLLARTELLLGRRADAIAHLKKIEEGGEPRVFQARELRWIGTTYAEMGDLPGARRLARRMDSLAGEGADPYDNNSALSLAGEIALAEGKPAEAVDHFQKALAVFPSSWAHMGLARTYTYQQDWQHARDEWQKVIAAKGEIMRDGCPSDWVLAHLELARVYGRLGDSAQARAHYLTFLRTWADADDLAQRRQATQELHQLGPQ